jgi:uroporphyrin-III C-methyltransferase
MMSSLSVNSATDFFRQDKSMLPSAAAPPPFDPGSVWIVGAGPGDPGLLTLHALRALNDADVVLHDSLVSEEILFFSLHARLEQVGKRAGGLRTPQLRINQRLVELARGGNRVVRLKAGDPLIFGRGGEEALALAAAGIPFRIVPGISAGIGGTAAAGIPLTHRGKARSATFVTGQDAGGGLAELDWASLGRGNDVIVLYMAGRQLGAIAARLIAAGRDPDEPVALVRDATRSTQSVAVTTLSCATDQPISAAPLLIIIGPVVALREQLRAFQQIAPMIVALDRARLAS